MSVWQAPPACLPQFFWLWEQNLAQLEGTNVGFVILAAISTVPGMISFSFVFQHLKSFHRESTVAQVKGGRL